MTAAATPHPCRRAPGLPRAARIAVLALLAVAAGARASEPIVTTDLLRVRTVASIDVSRDGLKAVYAVRSIAAEDAGGDAGSAADAPRRYGNRSHLFFLDLFDADAEPRQLTFGRRMDGGPAISPDGRRVAFTREAEDGLDEDGRRSSQVWVMSLEGGEARQVTSLPHGASAPRWSPDGGRLLVESPVPLAEMEGVPSWPSERPGRDWAVGADEDVEPRPAGTREQIRAWLAGNARRHDPIVIDRLHFQGEQGLRGTMTLTQLFLVDPDDPDAEPRRLTGTFHDYADARFTPDGRGVVCVTQAPFPGHPDRTIQRNLARVDVATGDTASLLSIEGFSLGSPRFGPDGESLAFTGRRIDEPAYRQERLGVVTVHGADVGDPAWLTDEDGPDIGRIAWLPARTSLLFTSAREGGFPLSIVKPGRLDAAPLVDTDADGRPVGVHAFAAGGGAVVYTVTSAANPCVLRVLDGRADRLVQDLNPWVAGKTLSMPRGAWLDRPDGTRVQYWIMEPTDRVEKRRYPLCLAIHGGPSAMWGPGERTMWHEFQLLCAWGYGVVYANPRGSGGYGEAFLKANYQDWGAGPAGDVLAACDAAAREPWVDPDRLVVTGGSYAGYLTAWIVGHDHRFKAAVAQRGVYDLQTFFGEGNAWQLVPWEFGGYPWDAGLRAILTRESPFTYANRIRTPLLIVHASQDLRTGASQAEMLYRALKVLERPVEMVRYPGAGHDLSRTGDPMQRMDRLDRIIEFFERYVDNPRPAPVAEPGG